MCSFCSSTEEEAFCLVHGTSFDLLVLGAAVVAQPKHELWLRCLGRVLHAPVLRHALGSLQGCRAAVRC